MKGFHVMDDITDEEWFTLDDIEVSDNDDELYCIAVDSDEKQFLVGDDLHVPTHNTDEGKAQDELKGEAAMIIGSIARLGRAAGVHLVVATQRPDAKIISGETKANFGARINCGRTDTNASLMILGNGEGTRVKANPRGRLYLRIYSNGDHGQGFFADTDWLDNYLHSQGLNPDGTPIGTKQSRLAKLADMSEFEDADLDTREGVDNTSAIEKIREEDESDDSADGSGDDWGFDDDDNGPTVQPEKRAEKGFAELELSGEKSDPDKFSRPEDTWDPDLENLIAENNEDD